MTEENEKLLRECRATLDILGHRGGGEGCPTCDLVKRIDAALSTAGGKDAASAAQGEGG